MNDRLSVAFVSESCLLEVDVSRYVLMFDLSPSIVDNVMARTSEADGRNSIRLALFGTFTTRYSHSGINFEFFDQF